MPNAGGIWCQVQVTSQWLQFPPASRRGRQSYRSVPGTATASLPHPLACPAAASASQVWCPSCSLAPLRIISTITSSPARQAGFILLFEPLCSVPASQEASIPLTALGARESQIWVHCCPPPGILQAQPPALAQIWARSAKQLLSSFHASAFDLSPWIFGL